MWMMPLHVNQKSDYDMMMIQDLISVDPDLSVHLPAMLFPPKPLDQICFDLLLIYTSTFGFVTSNIVRVSCSNQKTASVGKEVCFQIYFS